MSSSSVANRTDVSSEDIGVQQLSIQWIDFQRTQKYINAEKEEMQTKPLAEIVKLIVKIYNEKKQKREEEGTGFEFNKYKLSCKSNYNTQLYVRIEQITTKLTRRLKEGGAAGLRSNVSTNYLLFFFRQSPIREAVAITSGNAWEAVRSCIDYTFPIKVAERILDPHRIVEIARRCLVGPDVKEIFNNPTGREMSKTTNVYYLVESFRCKVKEGSSLMTLPFFKEEQEPIVKISQGLLRIQKGIPLTVFPSLLNLFSCYVRGRKTYNDNKKEEVADPGFEFLHFLELIVVKEKNAALDAQLARKVFDAYEQEREQTTYFLHKYIDDYFGASSWEILYAHGSKYRELTCAPTMVEEIIDLIASNNGKNVSSADALLETLQDGKLRYVSKEGKKIISSLIECFEGEVRDEEGDSYFKVKGRWYKLAVEYLALLQEDFRTLMRQVLIKKEEDGQLPLAWKGNKRQGQLTEKIIREKFHLREVRELIKSLGKTTVRYVNKAGIVQQRQLVGEILKVEIIKRNKEKVERELLSLEKLPSIKEIREIFGENGRKISTELRKDRTVLKKNTGKKRYVDNPFPYPLKEDPLLGGKYEEFKKFLEEQCQAYDEIEDEETYNRSYLTQPCNSKEGYLVFDQICPYNIEPCDVVKYTETTTYLYHIKEDFGHHTREACSQILNSAAQLRSALSTHQSRNFLDELWREATAEGNKGWRAQVKERLDILRQDNFFKIFYDRKIVFVYAFLEKAEHSMEEEVRRKSCLSVDDVGIDEQDREAVYQQLQKEQFLDGRGRLTGKFFASSQARFKLSGYEEESGAIYNKLKRYKSISESTLAKKDLLHLVQEIRALGFELKVCQIKNSHSSPSNQETETEETTERGTEDSLGDFSLTGPIKQLENGPVGLKNLGNSCYINATLQALFNIDELRQQIEDYEEGNSVIEALQKVLKAGNAKDAIPLLRNLRKEIFEVAGQNELTNGKNAQQDAHEFLQLILSQLGWKPIESYLHIKPESGAPFDEKPEPPTNHFSVSFNNRESFQEILDNHFALEEMVADGKKDKPLRGIFKKWEQAIRIKSPFPPYLIIHLKRFDFEDEGRKIVGSIEFPEDGLISIQQEDDAEIQYEIIAYINHHGKTMIGGHYTADIKNFRESPERWIHCDDDALRIQEPKNPGKDAYLVVLRQKNEESSPMEQSPSERAGPDEESQKSSAVSMEKTDDKKMNKRESSSDEDSSPRPQFKRLKPGRYSQYSNSDRSSNGDGEN